MERGFTMIYFDFSATTPADPRVLSAFARAAEIYGNYNSSHSMGREARAQIEAASHTIQELLHAEDFEVIYTSGATESNNLAIKGYCTPFGKGHIITTRFEHASVMAPIGELQRCGLFGGFCGCHL